MAINSTTEAHALGIGNNNVQFGISPLNVPAKVVIAATYDPLILTVVDEVPIEVFSAEDAGDRFGFGFPLHRLIKKVFEGNNGIGRVFALPQTETGTESDGDILWSGTSTAAGVVALRIGNELTNIDIPSGTAIEALSDLVVAAVNALTDTPVVAAKTAVTFETTFTSKAKGLEQDNITITLSAVEGEELPAGITAVITPMANGAGTPDIDDALNGLGTDDEANQLQFTNFSHGYGLDTATIDKVGAYVGLGNTFTGLYKKTIPVAFTSLNADTDPGTAALTALQVITGTRLLDRANGIFGAPDEDDIPTEIAALVTGFVSAVQQENPGQHYSDIILTGVGGRSISANRWTKNLDTRDVAVKTGISPSIVKSGVQLNIQNVQTFYRPANVPTSSNGYKSFRSIALLNNIKVKMRQVFETQKWQGINIVADASKVTDPAGKLTAKDVLAVQTELNNLSDFFEGKGWIFDAAFPKANSTVVIRAASNGFDVNYKFKLSGEGQVINITQSFDTNIAS